jgi:hypothetical protein
MKVHQIGSRKSDSRWGGLTVLGETDVGGSLTETLTADVEAVLSDETHLVGADTAIHTDVLV